MSFFNHRHEVNTKSFRVETNQRGIYRICERRHHEYGGGEYWVSVGYYADRATADAACHELNAIEDNWIVL